MGLGYLPDIDWDDWVICTTYFILIVDEKLVKYFSESK